MEQIEDYLFRNKRRYTPAFFGVLIALFFGAIFLNLINNEMQKRQAARSAEALSFAESLKTKIDEELNALLFISNGLASYLTVYEDDLKPAKVQAMLADFYQKTGHIKSLSIAEQYRIRYIYPFEEYQSFIGVDFRQIAVHGAIIETAVMEKHPVLAGPIHLVQGGEGLVYLYPVFIDGRFWGIISTVIDTQSFLKSAFANENDARFSFALRMKSTSDQLQEYMHGDAGIFKVKHALITEMQLPNGIWQWAIVRKNDGTPNIIWLAKGMALLVSILIGFMAFYFLLHREELKRNALHDALTGLPNRRLLLDRAQHAISQARRSGQYLAVMMIDVDHFKQYNDTFGHDFGDAVILKVSEKLAMHLRATDTLSRQGGDEFVLIFDSLTHEHDALVIAEKIKSAFATTCIVQQRTITLTISIGVAVYDAQTPISFKTLLVQADKALYAVKKAGRNDFKVFTH